MRVLLRLTKYAWRYRSQLLLAYLSILLSTLMYVTVPRLLGTAIDTVLTSGDHSVLFILAAGILLISVLGGVFTYGQNYFGESVAQRVAYDLRNAFYDKLQRLSFAYHDHQQTGNLMSKATADVDGIRWFVNLGLVRTVNFILLVTVVSSLLITMNWKLGLVSLSFIPIIAGIAIHTNRRLRRMWRWVQEDIGRMTTVLHESIAGIRVVKAFTAEEHEKAKFDRQARTVAQDTYAVHRLHDVNSALMTFIFSAATCLILWLGGREVIDGRLTAGELAQFILYMGILAMPVRMTGWLVNVVARATSAGERIFETLDTCSPVQEKPLARHLPKVRGHVRFNNASFQYDRAMPVLHNISFEARPGQRVALLGAPGSGKSTIVHLLTRFYDVSTGHITIDGTNVQDATLSSLRRNVGIVQQDVFLFTASIRDNIAYGKPTASLEEVIQAAKVAQLHNFIERLPQGYATWVGERGVTLSGGQRQRLAIARTLLLDPPILVLDDSTSSVDNKTEHLLQQAISSMMDGRTTFIIAHRMSSVQQAHLILVMDNGRIAEHGTHQELMEHSTLYKHIYHLQITPREAPRLLNLGTSESNEDIP